MNNNFNFYLLRLIIRKRRVKMIDVRERTVNSPNACTCARSLQACEDYCAQCLEWGNYPH